LFLGALLLVICFFPKFLAVATFDVGPVGLVSTAGPVEMRLKDPARAPLELRSLEGSIHWRHQDLLYGLDPTIKWPLVLLVAAQGLFVFTLFDLLRRLFRNVQRGDSFLESNIRLVQIVGVAIIGYTVVSSVLASFFEYRLLKYLGPSATVLETEVLLTPARSSDATVSASSAQFRFSMDFEGILTGLLVLALAEVFRQGRLLQEENRLTI
jgi:hypothetical protein